MKKTLLSFKFLVLFLFCFSVWNSVEANNIRIPKIPVLIYPSNPDQADWNIPNGKDSIVKIRFDVYWDNSWRSTTPNNYDAAWVFVKCWDGTVWKHVYLDTTTGAHKVTGTNDLINFGTVAVGEPLGFTVENGYSKAQIKGNITDEPWQRACVGVFIHRTGRGRGNVMAKDVELKWNYKAQGFTVDDNLAVKVFAVEMVYIPKGDYFLGGVGSGAAGAEEFGFSANAAATPKTAYKVTSENAITCTASVNSLWAYGAAANVMVAGNIPDVFPKGYQAFYIMKYELTQEAYADFLNTMDFARQNAHMEANLNALLARGSIWDCGTNSLLPYRQGVVCTKVGISYEFGCDLNGDGVFNKAANGINQDGQDVAVSFVSFYDLCAYACFAGLRPITEMEYEKACRGQNVPVANEYAWGNTYLQLANFRWNNGSGNYQTYVGGLATPMTGTERVSAVYNATAIYSASNASPGGQCGWWGWWVWWWNEGWRYPGPMRVGAFADSTTSRQSAGASYYGVMNLSDNVSESCVNAGTARGREFKGYHGCGDLNADGSPRVTDSGWYQTAPDASYFIPRGMNQYYYYNLAGLYQCATNSWFSDWTTGASVIQAARGQIDNRGMANHAYGWGVRNTITANVGSNADRGSTNYMNGIRCGRTQGAQN